MRGRSILVVGDLMIDEWIWGTVSRISPEAPVPVVAVNQSFVHARRRGQRRQQPAFARCERRIRRHGRRRCVCGRRAAHACAKNRSIAAGVFAVSDRPTTRKTRVVAHNQQVVRADWEDASPLRATIARASPPTCASARPRCDAVILSDYAKGLICEEVVEAARACPLVLADPKPQNVDAVYRRHVRRAQRA